MSIFLLAVDLGNVQAQEPLVNISDSLGAVPMGPGFTYQGQLTNGGASVNEEIVSIE